MTAKSFFNKSLSTLVLSEKEKYFCIGRNKTGTTSLARAFEDFGFRIGDQLTAEKKLFEYAARDFRSLIDYCGTADVFQDVPFSFPYTFMAMDQAFPQAKFILTVRDSSEEWYDSMIRFQGKTYGNDSLPTLEQLKNSERVFKGFAYHTKKIVFNTPDDDLYNRAALIHSYEFHNEMVVDYFRSRPDKLLVLNLQEKNAYLHFCEFINKPPLYATFPWLNKT